MCTKNRAWLGGRLSKIGTATVVLLLALSHPRVDVYGCVAIIEFTEYQKYLCLHISSQNSNEGQMSWLFVLIYTSIPSVCTTEWGLAI